MDEITGFDNQVNGWFDRFNPIARSLKKANEQQKRMIQQKMNQSNSKAINFDNTKFGRALKNIQGRNAKKQMIIKLINSL